MKFCNNCGNSVPENSTTCLSCGKDQRPPQSGQGQGSAKQQPLQHDDTFLKVLCILTIVGAAISLLSAAATMRMNAAQGYGYLIFQIVALLAVTGKMTGAILMLQKRLTGLYIYTVAASVNILLTVGMAFGVGVVPTDGAIQEGIVLISVGFGLAFAIAFLVMYWLEVNRRLLS